MILPDAEQFLRTGAWEERSREPSRAPDDSSATPECVWWAARWSPAPVSQVHRRTTVLLIRTSADLVLQADPRHVLVPAGQSPARPGEQRRSLPSRPPVGKHQTGSGRTTRTPASCAGAVAASQSTQPCRKPEPAGADSSAMRFQCPRSTDRAGVDQDRNPGLDHGRGDHLGGVDTAVAQDLLVAPDHRLSPTPTPHRLTTASTPSMAAGSNSRCRDSTAPRRGRSAPAERSAQHPMVSRPQRGGQRRTDDAGRTGDGNRRGAVPHPTSRSPFSLECAFLESLADRGENRPASAPSMIGGRGQRQVADRARRSLPNRRRSPAGMTIAPVPSITTCGGTRIGSVEQRPGCRCW